MSRLRHLGNRAVKESTLHFIDGILVSLSGGIPNWAEEGSRLSSTFSTVARVSNIWLQKLERLGQDQNMWVWLVEDCWHLLQLSLAVGYIFASQAFVYFKKNTHIEINHEIYGGWKIRVHWLSGISTPISSSLVRLGWAIRALSGETMRLDITETECLWADSWVSKESISSDPGGWLRKWGYVFYKVSGLKEMEEMRVGQPKSGCKLCEISKGVFCNSEHLNSTLR